jgi:hypothetical protein
MMVFRLHGDELVFGGAVHPVQPQIPQMKMMKVHIPFTFKLQECCRSSHSGELCDLLTFILCFHKFTVLFAVSHPAVHRHRFFSKCGILGFRCGVVEAFTFLGYYTEERMPFFEAFMFVHRLFETYVL